MPEKLNVSMELPTSHWREAKDYKQLPVADLKPLRLTLQPYAWGFAKNIIMTQYGRLMAWEWLLLEADRMQAKNPNMEVMVVRNGASVALFRELAEGEIYPVQDINKPEWSVHNHSRVASFTMDSFGVPV